MRDRRGRRGRFGAASLNLKNNKKKTRFFRIFSDIKRDNLDITRPVFMKFDCNNLEACRFLTNLIWAQQLFPFPLQPRWKWNNTFYSLPQKLIDKKKFFLLFLLLWDPIVKSFLEKN